MSTTLKNHEILFSSAVRQKNYLLELKSKYGEKEAKESAIYESYHAIIGLIERTGNRENFENWKKENQL